MSRPDKGEWRSLSDLNEERIEDLERKLEIAIMESRSEDFKVKAMSQIHDVGLVLLILGVMFWGTPVLALALFVSGFLVIAFGPRVVEKFVGERAREYLRTKDLEEEDD